MKNSIPRSPIDSPTTSDDDPWLEGLNWVETREGQLWLDRAMEWGQGHSESEVFQWLHRELDLAKSAFLSQQVGYTRNAARKFREPAQWLWTKRLFEQASDQESAILVASYFPPDRPVHDFCCGAGVDAVSLGLRAKNPEPTIAIDMSQTACRLTNYHAKRHRSKVEVHGADVESWSLDRESWIHADPDRRATGHRTTTLENYLPGLECMSRWLETSKGGSIKLAPASTIPESWSDRVGLQWIGVQGSVRQQRVWWGVEPFPVGSRTVSIATNSGQWSHWSVARDEWSIEEAPIFDGDDEPEWIGDTDPAIRAAQLNPVVARHFQAELIGDAQGYLVASKPTRSDFVDWFQVESIHAIDVKKLRRHLRELGIGKLEIKKRGVETDLDEFRRSLKLEGDRQATLILFRNGRIRQAALTHRMPNDYESSVHIHD